jgi:hypothetical protein
MQEQFAQRLSEAGAARLNRGLDAVAVSAQHLGGAADLGGLAGALGAFESDEASGG